METIKKVRLIEVGNQTVCVCTWTRGNKVLGEKWWYLPGKCPTTRRCNRKECMKYFIPKRNNQKFCSHSCAVSVSVRKFRSKNKKAEADEVEIP